jgi:hypothetical protein
MATTIITKHGEDVPLDTDLVQGELALDLKNKRIYSKDPDGNIIQLGSDLDGDLPGVNDDDILLWSDADDKWTISEYVPSTKFDTSPPANPKRGMLWQDTTNDEQALYCFDGTVWFEISGANGADGSDGNIQDGASDGSQDGIVATWDSTYDQWRANTAVTVDATGNVGIGTPSPSGQLHIEAVGESKNRIRGTGASGYPNLIFQTDSNTWQVGATESTQTFWVKDATSNVDRLTIDASGDATFSQSIHLQDGNARFFWNDTVNETRLFSNGGLTFRTGGFTELNTALTIDASGNATFSGSVNANNIKGQGDRGGLLFDGSGNVIPTKNGAPTSGQNNLGANANKWNQLFAITTRSQRVIQDGSPVVDAKGLIKTLSTLRQATLDETQDIRESLRSAIDELVAGLEHEISTMPAPEPEVSTMEEAE